MRAVINSGNEFFLWSYHPPTLFLQLNASTYQQLRPSVQSLFSSGKNADVCFCSQVPKRASDVSGQTWHHNRVESCSSYKSHFEKVLPFIQDFQISFFFVQTNVIK